jgi:hypothetical protein
MQLLTKCVDIVYFKNNIDKSTFYITDEFEAFLPLFHDWLFFLRMLHHEQFCGLLKNFAVLFLLCHWGCSKIKAASYICSMNVCRIMIIDSVFLCHTHFPDMVRSARKSMLGKRKNIPRPIPIQPPVSTVKHHLGMGKEQ